MSVRILLIPVFWALSTSPLLAHEFWIDPETFQVAPDEPIVADIRVGEEFRGPSYSYFPNKFRRFEVAVGDTLSPVESRLGDRPAMNQAAEAGLAVIVHETKDLSLTYSSLEKFRNFVTHKDAEWVLAAHEQRGLPDEGFREAYSRYAKSLVSVGEGAGADREVGLETELVAGLNPYTDDLSGGLPVTLLYKGEPRADAQVEIFERGPDGEVAVSTARTDQAGVAIIPVSPGYQYMLDAVVLREPASDLAEKLDVDWESLWANLTFAVPEARS